MRPQILSFPEESVSTASVEPHGSTALDLGQNAYGQWQIGGKRKKLPAIWYDALRRIGIGSLAVDESDAAGDRLSFLSPQTREIHRLKQTRQ